MRKIWAFSCIALLAVICLAGFTGCQSSAQTAGTDVVTMCPNCNGPLRTVMLKDAPYAKCVCADCKKVSGPHVPDEMKVYLGVTPSDMVQVCDKCKTIVGMCPECRKSAKMK